MSRHRDRRKTENITPTPGKQKRFRTVHIALGIIFVIALTLRIAYIRQTDIDTPIRADARNYVIYANNLVKFGTFSQEFPSENPQPDSYRSPGYPLFIALSFLTDGEKGFYPIVIYTQTVLSALCVVLTFYLGMQFLPVWYAFAASVLVAFSPHLVSMTSYVLTETLFSFVLLAALTFFHLAFRKHPYVFFTLSGLLFGYGYLINPTIVFFPFVLMFIILAENGFNPGKILHGTVSRASLLFLVVYLLFPAGWQVRNIISLPENAPKGSSRAMTGLVAGTVYPDFTYKDPRYKMYPYKEDDEFWKMTESFSHYRTVLFERFKQNPKRYLWWFLIGKAYYQLSWNLLEGGQGDVYVYPVVMSLYQKSEVADATRLIMKFLHPIIVLIIIAGLLFFIKYRHAVFQGSFAETPLYVLSCFVYFFLIYFPFTNLPRYEIPLRPEMYLCSLAVAWSFMYFRMNSQRHAAVRKK
ncbi:glycosyltransferase family 39 protein [bacterium]|nr:glycosyltransferase family 39 protein [bacterium]